MKKPLIWIIVIAFITILLVGYFGLKRTHIDHSDTLMAIPQDAALILISNDMDQDLITVLESNEIWNGLTQFSALGQVNAQLIRLDSLIRTNPQVEEIYKRGKMTFSLHKSGRDKYEYIMYVPLINIQNERQIVQFIQQVISDVGNLSERKYSNVKIYDIHENGNKHKLSLAFTHGLIILSPSGILVEEAIRQLDINLSITDHPNFIQLTNTAGKNVEANIYLNYKSFAEMLSLIFKDPYRKSVQKIARFAAWSELDLSIREDALLFNGFTLTDIRADEYLGLFLHQEPQKIDMEEAIPDQVAGAIIYGFDKYEVFKEDYNQYILSQEGSQYINEIQSVNSNYDINLEEAFSSFIDNEAGIVITDIKNYDWDQNTFLVFKTIGRSVAEDKLNELLEKISAKDNVNVNSFRNIHKLDDGIDLVIYEFPIKNLARYILGDFYQGTKNNYFTFFENYLIFGNSVQALSKYVHSNLLRSNLRSDLEFHKFSNYLSSRSNLYVYLDISRSFDLMNKYLREDVVEKLQTKKDQIDKFHAFAYQVTAEGDMLYNNLFIKYRQEIQKEPQTVWESRLEQPILSKPTLVTNHYTQDKEIFIQDKGNNIYLLNNSGRILWKQKTDGKILGEVYQVDFYKNGKLQFLFNTKEKIYLLDRNGNPVEKYPVQLRSPATNGLALFDYEQNRDYRLFVATEDHKLYAYDKEGNTIKGWEFERSDHVVRQTVQHFRLGDKDYLIFADQYRVYILDRKGKTRIQVTDHFPVSANNDFNFESNTTGVQPRFVTTDTTGHVHFIYLDGTSEEFVLGDFSADHYFEYADINGNGKKEFIFLDGTELKVFSYNKKQLFSYSFRARINEPPVLYQFSSTNIKIGVVSSENSKIFLINNDGSAYKGFPLSGSTPFSIGYLSKSTSKFNLLVGSDHNFLYNYSVQ
ncbi:MAG: DUF3352 domain-containing protein [Bacteroidales bacterium]|nr:DUF3352 domain-containing protein [Bacteroidales bacterium]